MTNTGNDVEGRAQNKPTRPRLKWYWKLAGILFFGFTLFHMVMLPLDFVGIESIRCEISSAKSHTSSGGTRGSASTAGVMVETTNCGSIYVSPGVTFDNQDEVAASFKAGSEYEFDLGWYSRVWTRDIRQGIPSVQDYRWGDCDVLSQVPEWAGITGLYAGSCPFQLKALEDHGIVPAISQLNTHAVRL